MPMPPPSRWRQAFASLVLAFVLLVPTGCADLDFRIGTKDQNGPAQIQPNGEHKTVPLQVVEGQEGQVLAFVPVFINGQGPFPFALDTGASRTLIDRRLVDELDLEVTGTAGPVSGVAAKTTAEEIRVETWRLGDIELEPGTAVTLQLGGQNGEARLAGLIGSDILSNFGVITVDYNSKELRLSPRS